MHQLRVRVDDSTLKRLRQIEAETGLNLSGYLRISVFVINSDDLINPKAVRPVMAEEGQQESGALDTAEVETN